ELREHAYEDQPLPIGYGQTISQPYIVALTTDLLRPPSHGRALEIGTGSGYQAAVLAELVHEVYTIEIVPSLAEQAAKRLSDLGYATVHVRRADGYFGWPEAAPFDGISESRPPACVNQSLAPESIRRTRKLASADLTLSDRCPDSRPSPTSTNFAPESS